MGRFGGPVGRVGAKMRHGAHFVCGMWKAGILTIWSHLTRSLTESGGWALQVRWTENSRVMLRAVMICGVLTASAVFVAQRLQGFGWDAAWSGLMGLPAGQIGMALMAVALAFVAVAGQERAVLAHLALAVARGAGGRAAMAAAAVSQTVGFGPVVGAIVRQRLLHGLTMGQSFAISACITVGFFAGICLLALAGFAVMPGHDLARGLLAVAVLGLVGAAVVGGPTVMGFRKPNLFVMARFLGWLAVDLTALAAVLWLVLPGETAFLNLLPVFLIALGIGVASGSPGGVGPFEATLVAFLPQVGATDLVAGIIAFRVLAYVLPALCGAVWALIGPWRAEVVPSVLIEHRQVAMSVLRKLPGAEVQLVRQGRLTLLAGEGGYLWLSGTLAHTRVLLGAVMSGGRMDALRAVERLARAEARVPLLYKMDARMAALARRQGYAVIPVAREAVLEPAGFTVAGPERARLRRKVAHAQKAGVVVSAGVMPSLIEMQEVVDDWVEVHGPERGFSMGRWEAGYVAEQQVICARSPAGVLLAFITLHAGDREWVLDLVRVRPGAPDGTTYAMVCCALEAARAQGVARLSLAAVPEFGQRGVVAHVLRCVAGGRAGLDQFKSAFAPKWEMRYAAAPGWMALALGGVEVALAILRPGKLGGAGRARWVVHQGGKAAKVARPAKRAA
jgi:phosphatidylglycerol lysyltransferase